MKLMIYTSPVGQRMMWDDVLSDGGGVNHDATLNLTLTVVDTSYHLVELLSGLRVGCA